MKLNVKALRLRMLEAARIAAEKGWPALESEAGMQLTTLLTALAEIQRLHSTGRMTEQRAKLLASMYERGVRTALAGVQGLGTLTAERATHAATAAIAADVNRAVGFKLL